MSIVTMSVKRCRSQLRAKLERKFEAWAVSVLRWAFSKKSVQKAIVEQISCRTPIGDMLNQHIESAASDIDVDAGDIHGLDREIEEVLERMLGEIEIDVERVNGFEKAVQECLGDIEVEPDQINGFDKAIEEALNEQTSEVVDAVIGEIASRLQK